MTEVDLAYIAGLMDGEAYVGIKKTRAYKCQGRVSPGYHARIQIRMVDEAAIRFIATILGGWYYKEKPSVAQGRPLYCYQTSDAKAEEILRLVLPYLRVKRATAETVLRLRELQGHGKEFRTKVTGYRSMPGYRGGPRIMPNLAFSDEYVTMCEQLYVQCKTLNAVGI